MRSRVAFWVCGVLGALAVFAAWAPALSFYFSQDDFPLLVSSHPGWVSPLSFFSLGSPREYRPLTQHFFFWLVQRGFGADPVVFHAAVLGTHLLNVVLVAFLARRWLKPWAALGAAVIFGLHPIHFYEVSWVSGISPCACVTFMLGTLLLLERYLHTGRRRWLALSVGASAAALLSKEDGVVLAAIVTLRLVLEGRSAAGGRRRLVACVPYWLVLVAYLLVRFVLLGYGLPEGGAYDFGASVSRIAAKLVLDARWLLVSWTFATSIGVVFAVAIWAFLRSRRERGPALRWAAAVIVVGIISVGPTLFVPSSAEHYLSFASAAFALLVAGAIESLPGRGVRGAVIVLVAATFAVGAAHRRFEHLTSARMDVPVPRKAELCRAWVESLRRHPPPAHGDCRLAFTDVPLTGWEKGWFVFVPVVAWDRPIARPVVTSVGEPVPELTGPCVMVWSLAAGEARLVRDDRGAGTDSAGTTEGPTARRARRAGTAARATQSVAGRPR